jgi:hypothetical protein
MVSSLIRRRAGNHPAFGRSTRVDQLGPVDAGRSAGNCYFLNSAARLAGDAGFFAMRAPQIDLSFLHDCASVALAER